MRLIQTRTCQLVDFFDNNIPLYAVLSHTWGLEEVSYQEMQTRREGPIQKVGYKKIAKSCEIAAADGFDYIWVDTCCIDKTSSSELSEAINSMYRWYEAAEVCYVYMSDVPLGGDPKASNSLFSRSRWFTRGWTLQELVAPTSVLFLANDWNQIGTKFSLRYIISGITGIQLKVLIQSTFKFKGISVAQKMSWAANRETTRVEDIAYCLMGLFGINMPMLYGEGIRAFRRLQEEILKVTDDQSIFAWKSGAEEDEGGGLLASSPARFLESGNFYHRPQIDSGLSMPPFISSKGINLELPIIESGREDTVIGILGCARQGLDGKHSYVGIFLSEDYRKKGHFRRSWPNELKQMENADNIEVASKSIFAKSWNDPNPSDLPWSLQFVV